VCYVRESVLGAGAGAKRRRAKPVDPAREVSCAGGDLALAAAIRENWWSQQTRWFVHSCCCEMEVILRCLIGGEK
jgi:hypothetical protein